MYGVLPNNARGVSPGEITKSRSSQNRTQAAFDDVAVATPDVVESGRRGRGVEMRVVPKDMCVFDE
jgi:hypothetical protein